MAHNDGASEQTDDAWQPQELAHQVCEVSIQQNQTGLFDGVFIEGL